MKVQKEFSDWVSNHWDADEELVAMRLEKFVTSERRRKARYGDALRWLGGVLISAIVLGVVIFGIGAFVVMTNNDHARTERQLREAQTALEKATDSNALVDRYVEEIANRCLKRGSDG